VSRRGVRRYVDDLLSGQRPRGFRADEEDAAELRTAIALRAARPGDDEEPRPEFVAALHRRLAEDLADEEPRQPAVPRVGRRGLALGGLGLAAASAAVGVIVDRSLVSAPGAGVAGPAETLTPTDGAWRTVAAASDLPEGGVRAFDTSAVAGFVERTQGVIGAVSATCTHQGCRLYLDPTVRRLACPCHATTFAVTGEVVAHQLSTAPAPLPRIAAREVDGAVQVFVNRA
jgi:nitrite reductase/ring-hydroxylating ferredoxin subunit